MEGPASCTPEPKYRTANVLSLRTFVTMSAHVHTRAAQRGRAFTAPSKEQRRQLVSAPQGLT
jgi:hypothetical protein